MTPAEARELFSAAYDGELESDVQSAFEATLTSDPELKADFGRFRAALDLTRGILGAGDQTGTGSGSGAIHVPNLLPGVQHRLRVRSQGRYYGNRYVERRRLGRISPVYLVITVVAALVSLWIALSFLTDVMPSLYPM